MCITFYSSAFAQPFQRDLEALPAHSKGHLGVCVQADRETGPLCIQGNDAFPLQSVMKLIVGVAVLDAVDRSAVRLEDKINIAPDDVSPGPEELGTLSDNRVDIG